LDIVPLLEGGDCAPIGYERVAILLISIPRSSFRNQKKTGGFLPPILN